MDSPAPLAVFLSYASQDSDAARRIAEALHAAGVEVWFDQSELRGGDVWDQKIRRQIKECSLFLPIISSHTQERAEGYFRLEWLLAVERSRLMAEDVAFLVPVVIDDTPDAQARVPQKFRDVQWTRLPGGTTPVAFVQRVQVLLGAAATPAPVTPQAPPASARASPAPDVGTGELTAAARPTGGRRRGLIFAVGVTAIAMVVGVSAWLLLRQGKSSAVGAGAPARSPAPVAPAVQAKSLAVLPFQNLSADKENEYLSDGITDELIIALQNLSGLQVKGRASSFYFKGRNESLQRMGEQLQVAYLLEGSVSKAGNKLRVNASLVKAADGFQLWATHYNREMADILDIRQDVARKVVEALKLQLGVQESRDLARKPTNNPEAYRLYLLGLQYYWRSFDDDYTSALRYFQQAIEIEPDYAPAYAGVALAYIGASTWVGLWSPREGVPKGRAAAEKAIALDPTLAEAYVALANIHILFDWDWVRGEEMIGRALALNPRSVLARYSHAAILLARGKYEEAAAEQAKAVELDPLSAVLHDGLGWVYWVRKQHERAIPHFRRAIELDRNYPVSYRHLGYAYLFSGKVNEALTEFQLMVQRHPYSPVDYTNLGYALGFAGRRAEARQILADLDRLSKKRYVSRIYAAYIHLVIGETEQALDSLEKALADRDGALVWNLIEPFFAPLRSEPRFRAMVREVGVVVP